LDEQKSEKVFVRNATGLVKELSLTNAIMIGVGIGENIPVGLPLIFGLLAFLFPSADFVGALVVGFAANLAIAAMFSLMGVSMPRSGGDYVWTSRVIGPAVGFSNNMAAFFAIISAAIGFVMFQFSGLFLSSAFQFLGLLNGNQGLSNLGAWFGTPLASFLMGSMVFVVVLIIAAFGLRVANVVQFILTILTVVGTFAAISAFATTSHQQFINDFNSYAPQLGSTYQNVLTVAQKNGWSLVAPTVVGSFLPLVFTFNLYGGFNYQAYAGGEMKRVTRNLPISIFLALSVGLLEWGLLGYFVPAVLGRDWFQAINSLYFNNPTAYSSVLTQPPSLTLFIDIMAIHNPALFWLIFIGFFASYPCFILAYSTVLPRFVFAWSFDRLIPAKLSAVTQRRGTPIYALILAILLSELTLAIYSFTPWVFSFVNFTLIFGINLIPWGLSGILFPYLGKKMYETAPSVVRKKIAGLPLVTIVGIIVLIIGAFAVYFDLLTPAYSGPVGPEYLVLTACAFIVPLVIYYSAKLYRKSKGLDLSLAFKEIPPE
jgi:APA family basic amino acid/polyamine antiporter